MLRCRSKVFVWCEQRQFIALAKLSEQGIKSADLDTSAAARITEFSCCDVVLLFGLENGEHREALHKLLSMFGTCKPRLGPANPYSTSWNTNPLMNTCSPPWRAARRALSSGEPGGLSRRKANDHTEVSTSRLIAGDLVRPCRHSRGPNRAFRTARQPAAAPGAR